MVQLHDEPYALWRRMRRKGVRDDPRFQRLLATISDWEVFLAFCVVDGCTKGKSRETLEWFFSELDGKVQAGISGADILRDVPGDANPMDESLGR